jgi:hypothetical protein
VLTRNWTQIAHSKNCFGSVYSSTAGNRTRTLTAVCAPTENIGVSRNVPTRGTINTSRECRISGRNSRRGLSITGYKYCSRQHGPVHSSYHYFVQQSSTVIRCKLAYPTNLATQP